MAWTFDLTDDFLADLQDARAYLTQDGTGLAAARQLDSIRQAVLDLPDNPYLWPTSAVFPSARKRVVGRYVIYYRLNEARQVVIVLRLYAPGQQHFL